MRNVLKSVWGIVVAVGIVSMSSMEARRAGPAEETREEADVRVEIGSLAEEMQELYEVEPLPMTMLEEPAPPAPTAEQLVRLRLIGRLAQGIRRVAVNKGGGRWWECGKTYESDAEVDAAIEWANRIVTLAWEYSDNGSDNGIIINPWEVAGIAAHECGFDRCALGKWPRKWGYENGTIRRSKRSISHPYEEIQATLTSPLAQGRWSKVGIDAAPLHVLWRCSDGQCQPKWNREGLPPIPMEEVFSLGLGFEYNVREMKKRAIDNKTTRPSLYWKGYRCEWYSDKITWWQTRLGARPEEV